MVCGLWFMVYGLWFMVYGLVYGACLVAELRKEVSAHHAGFVKLRGVAVRPVVPHGRARHEYRRTLRRWDGVDHTRHLGLWLMVYGLWLMVYG